MKWKTGNVFLEGQVDHDRCLPALDRWWQDQMVDMYASPRVARQGLLLGCPVWGEKFIDRLINLCLPSIHAPKNWDALRNRCKFVFFTDREGFKGLWGVADIFAGQPKDAAGNNTGDAAGAAVGSERLECAYNLLIWDATRVHPDDLPFWNQGTPVGRQRTNNNMNQSQGNGIPHAHWYNNTFGGDHSLMDLGTPPTNGGDWLDIILENNLMAGACIMAVVNGSNADGAQALNTAFGPGNWTMRRNVVFPGGSLWDATLVGGNNLNGYGLAGGLNNNFVDPASGNYRLVSNHPFKNGGTDGKDVGADLDYMDAMLAGIVPNTS